MHRLAVGILALALFGPLAMRGGAQSPGEPPLRLVVLIGVDQLRGDLLERYDAAYSGGLRRLLDEGFVHTRGIVDHAPTLTWPGMTTLATGAYPRTHGIASHALWQVGPVTPQTVLRPGLATADAQEAILGEPGSEGMSPRRIRVTGLADWIREADPAARTVALSNKNGAAVLLGGRLRPRNASNHVYWLSGQAGRFVTSSYYRESYPDWLTRFNAEELPRYLERDVWECGVRPEHRALARADAAAYEGDQVHTTFPHVRGEESSPGQRPVAREAEAREKAAWLYSSPSSEEALFHLAREAVRELALGQRDSVDLLALTAGMTDTVGHKYGPLSLEQLDNLVRLDRELGALFTFLDARVGAGRWVAALSADHGAPNVAEYELEQGRPARRVGEPEIRGLLERVERLADGDSGSRGALARRVAAELQRSEFVARAMTPDELRGPASEDPILRAYQNSFLPGEAPNYPLWDEQYVSDGSVRPGHPVLLGVIVELKPGVNIWTARSTHGSAHAYDREVPIAFLGRGVAPGRGDGSARTIDVAPTLARLAGIPVPESVDGRPLALATSSRSVQAAP